MKTNPLNKTYRVVNDTTGKVEVFTDAFPIVVYSIETLIKEHKKNNPTESITVINLNTGEEDRYIAQNGHDSAGEIEKTW